MQEHTIPIKPTGNDHTKVRGERHNNAETLPITMEIIPNILIFLCMMVFTVTKLSIFQKMMPIVNQRRLVKVISVKCPSNIFDKFRLAIARSHTEPVEVFALG